MKVIKSGEKGFEQEKAKMFEPDVLSKEKQLRLVFYAILATMIEKVDDGYNTLIGKSSPVNGLPK